MDNAAGRHGPVSSEAAPHSRRDELTVKMPDGKKQKTKVPSVDDDAIQGVDTARD
ncbi:hypothetical protein AB8O64_09000 [Streptomyces sp. QH1-20]|uniref:hypothetical protein n=1 Tax=Streptomyces sp. QH1-20 TaxID=3240934 RepID=UPI003518F00E